MRRHAVRGCINACGVKHSQVGARICNGLGIMRACLELSVCSPRSRPSLVQVRAGTAFILTRSLKQKRKACPTCSYPGR
jgi:hypothetical protein